MKKIKTYEEPIKIPSVKTNKTEGSVKLRIAPKEMPLPKYNISTLPEIDY